jgi:hypothetical protein
VIRCSVDAVCSPTSVWVVPSVWVWTSCWSVEATCTASCVIVPPTQCVRQSETCRCVTRCSVATVWLALESVVVACAVVVPCSDACVSSCASVAFARCRSTLPSLAGLASAVALPPATTASAAARTIG